MGEEILGMWEKDHTSVACIRTVSMQYLAMVE
jgi:hypothetical protein